MHDSALPQAEDRRPTRLAAAAPVLALLPLAAFGILLLLAVTLERRDDRRDDIRHAAAALATGLDAELRAGLRALQALAGSSRLAAGDLQGFREEAQRLLAREPHWFTIALTDGERQLLNLRYPDGALLPPLQDLAAVAGVLRSGLPAPGGVVEGRAFLRVPVRVDGVVRRTLVATQEPTGFALLLDRAGLRPGWSALLVDGEGRLVARAASEGASGTMAVTVEGLRPALGQRRSLVEVEDHLAYALPVGESRWSVVVAAPRRDLAQVALGWLLAALGGAALLAGYGTATLRAARDSDATRRGAEADARSRPRPQERGQAGQLAAVGEALRGRLSSLLDGTERLADAGLPPPARALVDRQRLDGAAMLTLVEDMQDCARLEVGGLVLEDADIGLAELLHDGAAALRPLAMSKGLALRVAIDPGLPHWLRGDPRRLRQVVARLLRHAIARSAAGEVLLAARLTTRPEQVEIAVGDSGRSLAEAELSDIFAEPGHEGEAGSGLVLCRLLARAMDGSVAAANLPGRGARLVFRLPFRPGAAPSAARSGPALRVLVAEDVAASRILLTTMLARAGHAVTAVEHGPAALAALHGAAFDLAVLDLQMPGMGGIGVARAVRALPGMQARLPLIALTADPTESIEQDCRAAGFDAVLRKPFETRRLLGLVDGLRGRVALGA